MTVEHREQALALALVAVNRGLNLFREVAKEHIGLPHHRPDAAHLEHEPLQHARAALGIGGHELAGFLGQINQASTRLEHRKVIGLAVHDGGDAAIGADGQKVRQLLLALGQVQHLERVGQRQLFERNGDFVPVGRGGGVEVDHGRRLPAP